MLLWMSSSILAALARITSGVLHSLLYSSLLVTLAYKLGWVERIIWWMAEREFSRILNDTKITVGSFVIHWNLLQGRVTVDVSNIILHTPQRNEWKWESPLIARIGHAVVECNAPLTLLNVLLLRIEIPLELYTVQVSDVQVFVERKQNIFNFYLMNKSVILPDPEEILRKEEERRRDKKLQQDGTTSSSLPKRFPPLQDEELVENNEEDFDAEKESGQKKKAQRLVNEMLQAVKSLGQAAQTGKLQGALHQQGQNLADKLRGFQGKETLEEGVRLIHQVGKVAAESLAPSNFEQLKPEMRISLKPPPNGRVGCIVLKELRIFTRNSWIKPTTTSSGDGNGVSSTTVNGSSNNGIGGGADSGGWNKPIAIREVIIRASEFCPPMSLLDETGMPAIYQPMDKIVEVVWKRILAEIAKSNSGRLFQTALSEVLGFMKTNKKKRSISIHKM
jgi:hypothetical protein